MTQAKSTTRVPPSGVWCPSITFFDRSTDTLDLASQRTFYKYLSSTPLSGLVILGTNAEAFLLTREERSALIRTAREVVGPSYPILAGVGGHSTKQVLEYISDAHAAGADYVLVLPPAYFGKATSEIVIKRFFADVAEKSELPIVLYNFPGVCNGVDLDSDMIAELARRHEKVVGVKLTCGSVAKITRLAAEFEAHEFAVFGGQSDFLIGGLASGSAGCIAAFANVFPKSLARIYSLYQEGKHAEALALHKIAALAEVPIKSGSAATKYAAAIFSAKAAGIEDAESKLLPRTPYQGPGDAVKKVVRERMAKLDEIERGL